MNNKEIIKLLEKEEERKIKRLVEISFKGSEYGLSYLCDDENIAVGDLVYVDGKLEEQVGVVEKVLKTFKVPKFDMHWVTKVLDRDIAGTYNTLQKDFISFDSSLTAEKFCTMFINEKYNPDQVYGDENVNISLSDFDKSDLVSDQLTLLKGKEIYKSERILFISLKDGIGKAYVAGSKLYELDFKVQNGMLKFIACECPYFDNCKHEIALLFRLKELIKEKIVKENDFNFVLCKKSCFFNLATYGKGKIIIE